MTKSKNITKLKQCALSFGSDQSTTYLKKFAQTITLNLNTLPSNIDKVINELKNLNTSKSSEFKQNLQDQYKKIAAIPIQKQNSIFDKSSLNESELEVFQKVAKECVAICNSIHDDKEIKALEIFDYEGWPQG